MSIRRAYYAACDVIDCGDSFSAGTADTAADARANAADIGWKRIRGQDVCARHIVRGVDSTWRLTPDARLEH